MPQKTTVKNAAQTGPLPNPNTAAATVGQFSFRDGVWYLQPSPLTLKQPRVN
jgi:hypothetical protein